MARRFKLKQEKGDLTVSGHQNSGNSMKACHGSGGSSFGSHSAKEFSAEAIRQSGEGGRKWDLGHLDPRKLDPMWVGFQGLTHLLKDPAQVNIDDSPESIIRRKAMNENDSSKGVVQTKAINRAGIPVPITTNRVEGWGKQRHEEGFLMGNNKSDLNQGGPGPPSSIGKTILHDKMNLINDRTQNMIESIPVNSKTSILLSSSMAMTRKRNGNEKGKKGNQRWQAAEQHGQSKELGKIEDGAHSIETQVGEVRQRLVDSSGDTDKFLPLLEQIENYRDKLALEFGLQSYVKIMGAFLRNGHGPELVLKYLDWMSKEPLFDWDGNSLAKLLMEKPVVYMLNDECLMQHNSSQLPINSFGILVMFSLLKPAMGVGIDTTNTWAKLEQTAKQVQNLQGLEQIVTIGNRNNDAHVLVVADMGMAVGAVTNIATINEVSYIQVLKVAARGMYRMGTELSHTSTLIADKSIVGDSIILLLLRNVIK